MWKGRGEQINRNENHNLEKLEVLGKSFTKLLGIFPVSYAGEKSRSYTDGI